MSSPSSLARLGCAILIALTLAPAGSARAIPAAPILEPGDSREASLPPVRLRGGRTLTLPSLRLADAISGETAYAKEQLWVVQAAGRIDAVWREALRSAGAQIIAYLPENAYVIAIDSPGAAALEGRPVAELPAANICNMGWSPGVFGSASRVSAS